MSDYVDKMIKGGKTYADIVPLDFKSYNELLEKIKNEPQIPSVVSPFAGLNYMTDGFDPGRLYVIGAPPKQGKTLLVSSTLYQLAKEGIKSLLFSYEVSWQEIIKGIKQMEERDQVEPGSVELPLFMPTEMHRGGDKLQLQWLLEAVARAKDDGVKLIAIDHLHYLIPYQITQNFSIVIGNVVREIKRLAVLFQIPIILIVPMKNLQTKREPTFWDVRDSSMILHEADDVMIMYRLYISQAMKMGTSVSKEMISEQKEDDRYCPISVLSLELSRKRGSSGKIYLWHNGAYFTEINKDDIYLRVEEWKQAYVQTT